MEDVIHIPLSRGLFATIDAADYEATFTCTFADGEVWTGSPRSISWYAFLKPRTVYAVTTVKVAPGCYRNIRLHRFIMQPAADVLIDHRDGNGLNCARSNLRLATFADNSRNARPHGLRRYKGTSKEPHRKWRAIIKVNNKRITKGGFETEEDAAREYDRLARLHYGEFAWLNFPLEAAP